MAIYIGNHDLKRPEAKTIHRERSLGPFKVCCSVGVRRSAQSKQKTLRGGNDG